MARLIIVCGHTGAGKTSYANHISTEINAIQFSIDPWMQTLFSKDMASLDFSWMMERVERCQDQIWEVSKQLLNNESDVVLDLGFTTESQREVFVEKAKGLGVSAEIHFLDTPKAIRRQRVSRRNSEKDPSVYAFEVTDEMFDFMEPRFEPPKLTELENGKTISSTS